MEYNEQMAGSYGKVIVTPDNYMYIVSENFIIPSNPNESDSIIRWHKFDYTGCRFATEEETKKFHKELASNGYAWDEKDKAVKKLPTNLLFAKANLICKKRKEVNDLNKDIVELLDRWFNAHEAELEEAYGDGICWGGDWWYLENEAVIKVVFSVGYGEDSYEEAASVFLDGHWEKRKY